MADCARLDNVEEAAPTSNASRDPPQRNFQRREQSLHVNTSSIADSIVGALLLPSIAAAVGEALEYTLPTSWVTLLAGKIRVLLSFA